MSNRPGFGRGISPSLAPADCIGAARAAGVPRAFELLDSSGRCPRLLTWRPACERCADVLGVTALGCALASRPRSWRAARIIVNDGHSPTGRMHADFRTAISRFPVAAMRWCALPCLPWSAGLAFDGAESMPERCLVVGVPGPCDPSFARTGPLPRPCICRESWHGHGARSLRSVRLGLVRRNRPAQ